MILAIWALPRPTAFNIPSSISRFLDKKKSLELWVLTPSSSTLTSAAQLSAICVSIASCLARVSNFLGTRFAGGSFSQSRTMGFFFSSGAILCADLSIESSNAASVSLPSATGPINYPSHTLPILGYCKYKYLACQVIIEIIGVLSTKPPSSTLYPHLGGYV